MKKISFIVLCSAVFFSCSKSSNSSGGVPQTTSFAIDGIHDVTIDNGAGANMLPLSVTRSSANSTQEPITLSATGLPKGLTAAFNPASGTPSFATMLTYSYDYTGTGGTYPVKIVGTGASGTRQYNMNVILPAAPANGWLIDGAAETGSLSLDSMAVGSGQYYYQLVGFGSSFTQLSINFSYLNATRPHDGTYNVVSTAGTDDEVSIAIHGVNGYFGSTGADNKTLLIKTVNGKLNVSAANVALTNSSGTIATKHITLNVNQI